MPFEIIFEIKISIVVTAHIQSVWLEFGNRFFHFFVTKWLECLYY